MAKFYLTPEGQRLLNQSNIHPEFQAKVKSILESKGKDSIPESGYGDFPVELGKDFIKNQLPDIAKNIIPIEDKQKHLQDYIKSTADEANLTLPELQTRLQAFSDQAQPAGEKKRLSQNDVTNIIANILIPKLQFGNEYSKQQFKNRLNQVVPNILDSTGHVELGNKTYMGDRSPITPDENAGLIGSVPEINQAIDAASGGSPAINTTPDVKRIQSLIDAANYKINTENQINASLTALPEELRGNREAFLKGETQRAGQAFQEQIPLDLQTLNARGAAFSGDVGDLLTTNAFAVQNQLSALKADLENKDNQFFYNAAYQNMVRKLLEGNANLGQSLATARQNILTQQQQNFDQGQTNLNIGLNEKLYGAGLERQYRVNQQRLQNDQNIANRNRQNQLYSQAGQAVGTGLTVAGIATANPALTAGGVAVSGGSQAIP